MIETLQAIRENGQTVYVSNSGQQYKTLGGLGIITHDAVPDKPEDWGCAEWMFWHQALVKKHGVDIADQIWSTEFSNQPWYDLDKEWCQYNCGYAEYFNKNSKLRIAPAAKLKCGIEDVAGGAGDVLTNAGDVLSDAGSGISDTIGIAKKALPVLLLGVLAFAGYYGYQVATGKKTLQIGPVKLGKK